MRAQVSTSLRGIRTPTFVSASSPPTPLELTISLADYPRHTAEGSPAPSPPRSRGRIEMWRGSPSPSTPAQLSDMAHWVGGNRGELGEEGTRDDADVDGSS